MAASSSGMKSNAVVSKNYGLIPLSTKPTIEIDVNQFPEFQTAALKFDIQGRHGVQQRHQNIPILPRSQGALDRRRDGRDDAGHNLQVHGHAAQGEEVEVR